MTRPPRPSTTRKPIAPSTIALAFVTIAVGGFLLGMYRHQPQAKVSANATNSVPTSNSAAPGESIELVGAEPGEKAVGLLTEGNQLLESKDLEKAVAKYQAALKANPDEEDAYFNMGIALARMGKTNEAKIAYEEALKRVPDYAEVHINLGNLLMARDDLAGAESHFRDAIKSRPESATGQNALGTVYARQGKTAESTVFFAEAIRLQPGYAQAHVNLANAYISLKRFDEANRELRMVLSTNPTFEPARRAMARLQKSAR